MSTKYAIALTLTLAVAGVFWFRATAALCPVPLEYRLGELDESFGISENEALNFIGVATDIWETEVERDLFVYDEQAKFTINFVFDERQEFADSELEQRQALDEQRADNTELIAEIERLEAEYEALAASYDGQVESYEADLAAYNQRVNQYNDRGGAPSDVFAELEEERIALNQRAVALGRTADELNRLVVQINRLGEEGTQRVNAYNREVDSYNRQFGYEREFTQGDYQGDRINIYKFSSENELVTVLAHEFGHALSIEHVAATGSLMYYLMDDTDHVPTLSAADRLAYLEVCGAEQSFAQQLRHRIRALLP